MNTAGRPHFEEKAKVSAMAAQLAAIEQQRRERLSALADKLGILKIEVE